MGKKKRIAIYVVLTIAVLFLLLLIIDNQFHENLGSWWTGIHNFMVVIGDVFQFIFYDQIETFFFWNLIIMFFFTAIYIIGYNITKKRRVGGSITTIFCAMVFLVQLELTIIWGIFGLLANPGWVIQWKLILLIVSFPLLLVFIFFLNTLSDVASFWLDIVKERHEYSRIRYHIDIDNKTKTIHFDTDATRLNTVWSAAIYLLVEEILRKEGDSDAISRFIRSAFTNLIFEIATHFNIWHKFKNMLFRFVGLKIGQDVLISQYTRVDGLLPNLIYLEDHTAIGVSSNLITHTFIDRGNVRAFLYGPIRVCKFARVGANVTITPGITIGEGAVVAAGSLVNKDVPPYTLVGGVPAKVIKKIDPETYSARIEKDIWLQTNNHTPPE
ncbi:MAG: acyltransferase [Candidatus Helarchaeota archaeon]|nr:acyltransferase [Candidatus Helarchaeota archaeon]